MNKIRSTKGITLISLVITIIILIILAGITISSLTGSGLFENARKAEQKHKEAQKDENEILGEYEEKISEFLGTTREGATLTEEQYNQLMNRLEKLENNTNTEEKVDYSSDEKVIGTWIDGKTLYQKAYSGNNLGTWTILESDFSKTKKIISAEAFIIAPDSQAMSLGYVNSHWYSAVFISGENLELTCGASLVGGTYSVIVKYTK